MEKYYVHGCRSNGDEIERCEDSEAQFWTLYARDSEGLSEGIIDCVFREDAEAAMAVYAERDRLNADAALAEKSLKEANDVVLKAHEKFNAQNDEIDALREQVRALIAASLQEINDDMALAFHRAITDGDIGGDDIEEIKNGLRAAIANLFANTPTDAILSEVRTQARAEGIHFAANRLLAAWESGFVDDTPAEAHDISGAILSALEFLPNADEGEFKRDYADEVRARIRTRIRIRAGEVKP
ncbi:hypothetical protein [Pantoea coffeiphila]|uniref:hypothetical protein n=1 Tax=Pantoea coffeiphila TaxID=1465635 RepID=UPI001960C861|nr:hypothetical protein [Pantoea coffeiphila]MBM7346208.1 hypothetical protein [Pantoea coffeiphila]